MTTPSNPSLLQELQHLNAEQLRRLLVEHLTQQKLGLYWESNAIARDAALNANVVLPRLNVDASQPQQVSQPRPRPAWRLVTATADSQQDFV
jgi:hypothetical protein